MYLCVSGRGGGNILWFFKDAFILNFENLCNKTYISTVGLSLHCFLHGVIQSVGQEEPPLPSGGPWMFW